MEEISSNFLMKKVLNIVPYTYLPFFSGGQKLIAHFNEYLGAKTVLHVAGTSDNVPSLVRNYSFHPLLNRSRLRYVNLLLTFDFLRLIRKKSIDTVIIEHPYMGWLIPGLRLFSKVRIICHTHNVEAERFRSIGKPWWRILNFYEGWVLRNCDYVFCITEADRDYMVEKMKVRKDHCVIVPYGINEQSSPSDKFSFKQEICKKHNLNPDIPLLFFNGLLDYRPNLEALDVILEKIHPIIRSKGFKCNILIAGKRLPSTYNDLKDYNKENIFYAGFVDDINAYAKAADVLLNPVITGGGVKTKMIEALGMGTTVVSTHSGAVGVDPKIAGNKLLISEDNDWQSFCHYIIRSKESIHDPTPDAFYKSFYWGNIVKHLISKLK